MTSVSGAEFVALLAIAAVLLALPVLAGVSLLVARVSGVRLEWSPLTVHAVGIVAGDTPWDRGVWYATLGYAGGVGSAVVSLVLTGSHITAGVGAVVAAPVALYGLGIDRAVESGWGAWRRDPQ